MRAWAILLVASGVPMLAACPDGPRAPGAAAMSGAVDTSANRGARLIAQAGCGSCHTVPGVRGADGKVAPPLMFFSRRTFIAGELPDSEDNLVRWLKDPPAVEPGTAMPNLHLTDAQARDIAAYLETLE